MLIANIKKLHASSYLSLMSITQGVALGFLATTVSGGNACFTYVGWSLAIITFVCIVVVWHEYVIAVAALTWIPGLRDSFIPFLFAASEIGMAHVIGDDSAYWYLFMSMYCAIGFVAFHNMYTKSRDDIVYGINKRVLENTVNWETFSKYFASICCCAFFLVGIVRVCFKNSCSFVVSEFAYLGFASILLIIYCYRTHKYWDVILNIAKEEYREPAQSTG